MKNKEDKQLLEMNNSIYSSVPEFMDLYTNSQRVLFIKKQIVKEYFLNHKGKENAKPLNKIANELHLPSVGNSVMFRFIVSKLISEDKIPIVSSSKGYYYATTKKDVLKNIDREVRRIKGIEKRINSLKYILNNDEELEELESKK